MKSTEAMKYRLQMPALKKIMILMCVLFTGSQAHAQFTGLPCPDYVPLPADQYEIEVCGEPNNMIDGIFLLPSDVCVEPLTLPTPGEQRILHGAAESLTEYSEVDFYGFFIDKYTHLRLTTAKSHQLLSTHYMLHAPTAWGYCDAFTTDFEQVYEFGALISECTVSETVLLAPGLYYYYIQNQTNTGNPLGCGVFEYQVKLENLGEYFPGEICDVGTEITPAATWNQSNITADLNTGTISDDLNCAATDNPQKDLWFKFTATHENMLVSARRNGNSNLNVAIEVYEDCGAEPIICQDAYPGNANEVVVINNTVIGQQYYFRVYHNGSGNLSNGNIFAGVAYVPQAQLRASDCGLMNLTDASIIRSDWPVNTFMLEQWQFRFYELEPPHNMYEITSPNGPNPQFRMTWFPQREAGRTYIVQTRPKMYQGPTWADYGDYCIIGMAPQSSGIAQNPNGGFGEADLLSEESFELNVWPNPTRDQVTISFETSEADGSADMQIFDISGKQVDRVYTGLSGSAGYQNLIYNTDKLETGMYLIQIRTKSHSSVARLMVNK